MNTTRDRLLFAALKAALFEEACNQEPFDAITNDEWTQLFELSAKQGVLALTWDGVQRLITAGVIPATSTPDRTLKLRWALNVEQVEAKYQKQQKVLESLAAFYGEHGIRTLLLKGYGLSLCYPQPNHRPCGDIDIWLFGKQEEADTLLSLKKGVKIDVDKHHHTTFHIGGVMVENHYDFINIHSHRSNREVEAELKRLVVEEPTEKTAVNGVVVELPSPNFNALFLLRHAAGHFAAEEIAIRHIADWAMFVERYHDQINWQWLVATAKYQRMEKFLYCIHAIAVDYLGLKSDKLPEFPRDGALEARVLQEILQPEYSKELPQSLIRRILYKTRRWWGNRWKHRIVYREGLFSTFIQQVWSHLLKPKTI